MKPKMSTLMATTLLALSAFPLGPGPAPDIELPDTKDATVALLERERQQRAKFPSRKKRLKMRKP